MCTERRLRPHHLLCLGFFQGAGYSDSFSQNMSAVLQSLTADTPVTLAAGPDDICAACPQRSDGCPGAAQYDAAVLALCGWTAGQTLPWAVLRRSVEERILRSGQLESVCGQCQWFPLCHQALEESLASQGSDAH